MKKITQLLLAVGPGIFAIGYTVGTGSVTAMTKAGSQFGMELLWVLALSCLFSWMLMEAADFSRKSNFESLFCFVSSIFESLFFMLILNF